MSSVEWIRDKSLAGLYKRLSRSKPTWAVKARQRGTSKVVTVTLGRCDLMSVSIARIKAKEVLLALSQGIDPNDESRRLRLAVEADAAADKARSLTLRDALQKYLGYRSYKANTVKDINQSLARNFGDWLDVPLREISRDAVLQRFQEIKTRVNSRRKKVNERNASAGLPSSRFTQSDGSGEAQRAFRYLTAIFNSFKNDFVGDRPLLTFNPCDVLRDKKVRRVLKPREQYLRDNELQKVVRMLDEACHPEYAGEIKQDDADALMLMLLTGLRLNEARLLKWSNVDFSEKVFSVEDTKNHRTHVLPMTESLERIFKRMRGSRPSNAIYLFPSPVDSTRAASMSRTFDRVCMQVGVNFTPHDLRRTFATVAADMGVDVQRIGATLNHSKQGVTAGYIQTTTLMLKQTLEIIESAILRPYDVDGVGSESTPNVLVDIDDFEDAL